LSAYPIVFFGKSYVSPGYGPQLLYDQLPFVPGYQSSDLEALPADPGAMLWQNLPYSRVQHEAVFEHGEFPLWNRYNSGGVPLFGQGQSQILDPLHWIVVTGGGNGWAWDLKILLSKILFLAGIGSAVLLMTRSIGASIVIMMSSALIGLFYFRFNHPIFFNLTYAPWVLFFFLQWMQRIELSTSHCQLKIGWPLLGITVSSAFLLFAGTPKEGIILFGFLHLGGMIGILSVEGTLRQRISRFAFLFPLWIAIALITAPHWLIFLDTLGKMYTNNQGYPSCNYATDLRLFVDTLFQGHTSLPWAETSINVFLFIACLQGAISLPSLWRKPFFWATLVPLVSAIAIAIGIIPNSICEQIPFIGNIQHINHTFLTSAVVFAALFAGLGFSEFLNDLKSGVGLRKWGIFSFATSGLLIWWFISRYRDWSEMAATSGVLALAGVGGTIILLAISVYLIGKKRRLSIWSMLVLTIMFLGVHFHHGLHLSTGISIDTLLINPTPRANFLEPSPALSLLKGKERFIPAQILKLDNRSAVVAKTLHSARLGGGSEEDILRYEDDLRQSIEKSKDSTIATAHVRNFLRGVGAKPSSDNRFIIVDTALELIDYVSERERFHREPFRLIGDDRTPMSGFFSFLQLESLNGPDALRSRRYLDFLDMMNWTKQSGSSWLRTVQAEDLQRLKPLFDLLNVGYFLSRSRNPNMSHVDSNVLSLKSSERRLDQNSAVASVRLTRHTDAIVDRVGCSSTALIPDGKLDKVFSIELETLGTNQEFNSIVAIRLMRDAPQGVNRTGGSDYILGVSRRPFTPLLNSENGEVKISVTSKKIQLWLFACADGYDRSDSAYIARITMGRYPPLNIVYEEDMKIWKRNDPWPRAYFVDGIAVYNEVNGLTKFVREANGIPFAAIRGISNIPPKSNRTVVAASDYRLTSNTTAFHVISTGPGMVVLTETNVPGDTHATVNGVETSVITTNHAFRGIKINTAGEHEIIFSYQPRLWSISLLLSGVGFALLIALFLSGNWTIRRRKRLL
jgi:hypothetical protein